jgi:hypothetical protein
MAQQKKQGSPSSSTRSAPRSSRSSNGSSASARTSHSPRKRSNAPRSSTEGRATKATSATREGARTVGAVAKKATVPALAAGVGLAGFAGGVALAGRNSRKRVLGIPLPTKSGTQTVSKNLVEATENVSRFGEGMGSLAAEVRRVRDGLAAGGDEKRRSPIEVVLQGLTARR